MNPVSAPREYFDDLFATTDDPWRFRDRWYESRKRALTLACLPRASYASGYEPGCANGELSAALADRCDRLLVSDGTEKAVALAAQRLGGMRHVSVAQAWIPDDWPDARFDLIVVSELAYYLEVDALERLADKMKRSLLPGGDIVGCHWRHPIEGCRLGGDAVHEALSGALSLPIVWSLVDPDFRLEVWSDDARSVGAREALA